MTDEELAAQRFDERILPGLIGDGMPEDGITHLRERYIRDAVASEEAVTELRRRARRREGVDRIRDLVDELDLPY